MAEKTDGGRNSGDRLKGKLYDKELTKLHVELVKLQEWVKQKGLKVCIVFEGRDGAGKGGTIKALTERVSPRVFRVFALPAPTEREKTQMYIQRYLPMMPAAGEVVIWDRSWYNRAGVERVMGFCPEESVKRFLQLVPAFEKVMVESGIILLKYWLEVSMGAHGLEVSLDFALADLTLPACIRREREYVEHRAARRRLNHVRKLQRFVNDLRRGAVRHPHPRTGEARPCRIGAHVRRGGVGHEIAFARFAVDSDDSTSGLDARGQCLVRRRTHHRIVALHDTRRAVDEMR